MPAPSSAIPSVAGVTVIGTGLIGLTSALALAEQGLEVVLIGDTHAGEASPAGAGMLAPSVEDDHPTTRPDPAHAFAVASLARYPEYLAWLAVPAPRTIYRGISSLGPGECMRFRAGEIEAVIVKMLEGAQ